MDTSDSFVFYLFFFWAQSYILSCQAHFVCTCCLHDVHADILKYFCYCFTYKHFMARTWPYVEIRIHDYLTAWYPLSRSSTSVRWLFIQCYTGIRQLFDKLSKDICIHFWAYRPALNTQKYCAQYFFAPFLLYVHVSAIVKSFFSINFFRNNP